MTSNAVRAAQSAAPLVALLALATAGCGGGAPSRAGGAPPPPDVTVVTAAAKTVAVPYEFTGRVEGSREVEVRSRIEGILLHRTYDEGRPVRAGQTLFEIDPAPYRARVQGAEADLAEAGARRSRAEREVARLEPLLAQRATSQRDFDNAVSEAEQARAAVLSAEARLDEAKLDLGYTHIDAPIAGLSSRAAQSEGSLVRPGDDAPLTRIVQVQPIWVRFAVPDRTLLALRREVEARRVTSPERNQLEVELVFPDGSVHPERGRVNFSDSMISPDTGSIDLRAELANRAADLVPGQFVRVRLLGIERPNAILVPQRAVLQGQQGKFVYVVGAGDVAEIRPVEIGEWIESDWVIDGGLAAGERVVVDGVVKVRPGSPVKIAEPPAAGAPAAAGAGS
ncbi:MAG: efflux RND transporter periplasmic adaptor subunit [Thermoanaerobaculia bacterium]